jgi:molecular chaperone GrpE
MDGKKDFSKEILEKAQEKADGVKNHGSKEFEGKKHDEKKHDEKRHENEKKHKDEKEIEKLKQQIHEITIKSKEYLDGLQRSVAEFDNYKKRTAREKQCLYSDTTGEILAALLPVLDNLERAIVTDDNSENLKSFKEGVTLVYKQFKEILKDFGVEEIDCVGQKFDPQLHNAVLHEEDESLGENVVKEEFCKGYKIKDKVIRHSMVKVAN